MSKTKCGGQVTNVAAKQQTREHWSKTTISGFIVLSEELAKHSREITRLPKMGSTHWCYASYWTGCNCKCHHWPTETKLTKLFEGEIISRSSLSSNKKWNLLVLSFLIQPTQPESGSAIRGSWVVIMVMISLVLGFRVQGSLHVSNYSMNLK